MKKESSKLMFTWSSHEATDHKLNEDVNLRVQVTNDKQTGMQIQGQNAL